MRFSNAGFQLLNLNLAKKNREIKISMMIIGICGTATKKLVSSSLVWHGYAEL